MAERSSILTGPRDEASESPAREKSFLSGSALVSVRRSSSDLDWASSSESLLELDDELKKRCGEMPNAC